MSKMSKTLIHRLIFLFLLFILSFHSISQSSEKVANFKIENWIEGLPVLKSLVDNKKDVVEFDSSNGKIISIAFSSKNVQIEQIISFYKNYFKNNNWQKYKDENIWELKSERFKKKIFKIENIEDNNLTVKIIIENF